MGAYLRYNLHPWRVEYLGFHKVLVLGLLSGRFGSSLASDPAPEVTGSDERTLAPILLLSSRAVANLDAAAELGITTATVCNSMFNVSSRSSRHEFTTLAQSVRLLRLLSK